MNLVHKHIHSTTTPASKEYECTIRQLRWWSTSISTKPRLSNCRQSQPREWPLLCLSPKKQSTTAHKTATAEIIMWRFKARYSLATGFIMVLQQSLQQFYTQRIATTVESAVQRLAVQLKESHGNCLDTSYIACIVEQWRNQGKGERLPWLRSPFHWLNFILCHAHEDEQ